MINRPGAPWGSAARLAASGAAFAVAAGLAGCITLFPKEKPIQLYRFDAAIAPSQAAGRAFAVRATSTEFDPAAASDRIMTVNGDEIAYVDSGRWSSAASELFDEAVARGFAAGGPAHLVGASGKAEYRLHLTVSHFEARYTAGPTAPPTVVIVLRATIDRQADLTPVAAREFEADVPASDNRVGAIVSAYDAAATKVVGDLVAWVDDKGGG
jgi:cholesterol transport system auxiliary component